MIALNRLLFVVKKIMGRKMDRNIKSRIKIFDQSTASLQYFINEKIERFKTFQLG